MDDIKVTFNPSCPQSFIDQWHATAARLKQEEWDWIADLRARGVKAAHPNDGWVNRIDNMLQLVYPQFNDGVQVGDIIALGDSSEYHLVKITFIHKDYFDYLHYGFEKE